MPRSIFVIREKDSEHSGVKLLECSTTLMQLGAKRVKLAQARRGPLVPLSELAERDKQATRGPKRPRNGLRNEARSHGMRRHGNT